MGEWKQVIDFSPCKSQRGGVGGCDGIDCLLPIFSHLHSWQKHLRDRDKQRAAEWQVWCRANCCFTQGMFCPRNDLFITYLMQNSSMSSFLNFMNSACFIRVSHQSSALGGGDALGHSDLRTDICLFLTPIGKIWTMDKKSKWCNQTSPWLTAGTCPMWVDCEPIGVYWSKPSLLNPWRTSGMLRHVKQGFDFWDVCVRAGPTSNLPAVWIYITKYPPLIIQRF